ncbi:putative toxin-antitoxin system toxin component, PIN family [Geotalea uraniireducens]|uniref:putative toxin-antitoxin system toxin component, PIN family n=1 Tax=Geotalea uraniireducens TaxID=351604 RepID=UPI00030ED61D|nr:putative toxin-antitoxin system toxin component, PIN family [Geotalea uraniireducens]
MKQVILDTNVLVSALLFKGRLTRLVELWQNGLIIPVISRETFTELRQVLHYPKFALTADEIKAIIEDEILPFFDVVDVAENADGVCRDPYDDMFLAVAVSAQASYIVTGDKDLLALESYGAAKIVSPQEFLEKIDN